MSALMLKANDLNQGFNNRFHKTVPISWSRNKLRWSFESDVSKLRHYYFLNCIFILLPGPFVCVVVFSAVAVAPELLLMKEKVALGLAAGAMLPIVLLLEWLLHRYGGDVSGAANWALSTKNMHQIPPIYNYELGLIRALNTEVGKILRGTRPLDWYGLFAICFFFLLTMMSLVIPNAFVLSKLDPWNIFLKTVLSPPILNMPSLMNFILVKILIHLMGTGAVTAVMTTSKIILIPLLTVFQLLLEILRYLLSQPLGRGKLRLYNEFGVALKMNNAPLKIALGFYFGMAFYLLLMCMNLTLLGRGLFPWVMYMLMPAIGFMFGVVLLVCFNFGCGIYEASQRVILKWEREIAFSKRPREMRRIVRAMQPLALPVGEVGIMDRDIKKNYFNTLMNSFVSSSIVVRDFLN